MVSPYQFSPKLQYYNVVQYCETIILRGLWTSLIWSNDEIVNKNILL